MTSVKQARCGWNLKAAYLLSRELSLRLEFFRAHSTTLLPDCIKTTDAFVAQKDSIRAWCKTQRIACRALFAASKTFLFCVYSAEAHKTWPWFGSNFVHALLHKTASKHNPFDIFSANSQVIWVGALHDSFLLSNRLASLCAKEPGM